MIFLLANWRLVLEVVVIGALAVYAGVQRAEKDAIRAEYAEYRSHIAKAAVLAAERALQKTIADEKKREEADAENARNAARLRADVERLRRERDAARSSIVPATPAGSGCPEGQACFDRAELERALREYRQEVRGLVDEGSEVTVDLDTAKRWAVGR